MAFKQEEKTVAAIEKAEEIPFILEAGETLQGGPEQQGRFGTIIKTNVPKYYADRSYATIKFFDPKSGAIRQVDAYLYDKNKIHVLTGTMGKKVSAAIAEWNKHNFEGRFSRNGGNIGFDPEIFVTGKNGVLPAFEFLDSKKKASALGSANPAYWDGFQAEIAPSAGGCLAYVMDRLQAGLTTIYTRARQKDRTATLSIQNTVEIPLDVLADAKDDFVAFGCKPSFNAYDTVPEKIDDPRKLPFRFAGGHIHFSADLTKAAAPKIAKGLDKLLALPCVSLFDELDTLVPVRRRFYGLPGEYRLPRYGMEYRTLSNAWLCHPAIANLVVDLSRVAFGFTAAGLINAWEGTEEETLDILNNCDVKAARKVMKRAINSKILYSLLKSAYYSDLCITYGQKALMNGVASVIKDPKDLVENWAITNGKWEGHCEGGQHNWNHATQALSSGRLV